MPEVPGYEKVATLFDPGDFYVLNNIHIPAEVDRSTDLSSLQTTLERLQTARPDHVSGSAFLPISTEVLHMVEGSSIPRAEQSKATFQVVNRVCGTALEVGKVASQTIALSCAIARRKSNDRLERSMLHLNAERLLSALEERYPFYEVFDDADYMIPAAEIAAVFGGEADIRRALGFVDEMLERRRVDPTLFYAQHTFTLTQVLRTLRRVDKSTATAQRFVTARLEEAHYLNKHRNDGMVEPEEGTILGLLQEVFMFHKDERLTRHILHVAQERGVAPTEMQTRFLTERKGAGCQGDRRREALGQLILAGNGFQPLLIDERC